MQKGLQLGLLAAVAIGLGVVSCGLMDKSPDTSETSVVIREDAPANKPAAANNDIANVMKPTEKPVATGPTTTMLFEEYEHDFGVLDEGDKVEHIFTFTNTGENPLILENCKGSCGCTVPTCPKEPIQPGGQGEIKVVFNSRGKKNKQTKRVTITANTAPEAQTVLTITANVTPAPEQDQ